LICLAARPTAAFENASLRNIRARAPVSQAGTAAGCYRRGSDNKARETGIRERAGCALPVVYYPLSKFIRQV
jgi:hypothetical protein